MARLKTAPGRAERTAVQVDWFTDGFFVLPQSPVGAVCVEQVRDVLLTVPLLGVVAGEGDRIDRHSRSLYLSVAGDGAVDAEGVVGTHAALGILHLVERGDLQVELLARPCQEVLDRGADRSLTIAGTGELRIALFAEHGHEIDKPLRNVGVVGRLRLAKHSVSLPRA